MESLLWVVSFLIVILYAIISIYLHKKLKESINKKKYAENIVALICLCGAVTTLLYIMQSFQRVYLNDAVKSGIIFLIIMEILFASLELIRVKKQANKQTLEDEADEKSEAISVERPVESYANRVKRIICPFIYIGFVGCFSSVYEIYYSNIEEWSFTDRAVLVPALFSCCLIILIGFILAALLKGKSLNRLSLVLSSICVLSYLQYVILNGKLFIRGSYLESGWLILIINCIVWTVGIAFSLLIKVDDGRVKLSSYLVVFLLLIQIPVVPTLFVKYQMSKDTSAKEYDLDFSEQYMVGSEENVVVLILDAFYAGFFDDLYASNPEYTYALSDFIYYDNINTKTCCTALTMPEMLTAKDYDNTVSLPVSNANAWNSDTASYFYDNLHNDGYSVRFYTADTLYCGGAENMIGKIDNVVELGAVRSATSWPVYKEMLKLSLFKMAPFSIKNAFCVLDSSYINANSEYGTAFDISDDVANATARAVDCGAVFFNNAYYSGLQKGLNADKYKKCVIFQHLYGMHEKFEYLRDLDYPVGADSDGTKALLGCIVLVKSYLNELERLGVYDNSTVIITADHGVGDVNAARPIFFIKPKNYRSDGLVIKNAPGDVGDDLLPTILDCIGYDIPDIYDGMSVLSIDEDMKRERIIRMYDYSPLYKAAKKCNGMGDSELNIYKEYRYEGNLKDYDFTNAEYTICPVIDYWW